MRVKVNRTIVELFEGAKVREALLRYCVQRNFSPAKAARAEVFDAWGHPIDQDAPLSDGQTIKCKISE